MLNNIAGERVYITCSILSEYKRLNKALNISNHIKSIYSFFEEVEWAIGREGQV